MATNTAPTLPIEAFREGLATIGIDQPLRSYVGESAKKSVAAFDIAFDAIGKNLGAERLTPDQKSRGNVYTTGPFTILVQDWADTHETYYLKGSQGRFHGGTNAHFGFKSASRSSRRISITTNERSTRKDMQGSVCLTVVGDRDRADTDKESGLFGSVAWDLGPMLKKVVKAELDISKLKSKGYKKFNKPKQPSQLGLVLPILQAIEYGNSMHSGLSIPSHYYEPCELF